MPVKIFIPKITSNEDEFISFIKKMCNPSNIRIAKNKDGTSFCVISLNYNENVKCANDIIKEISGKVVGDIVLKPRIYVDQSLMFKLSNPSAYSKDSYDDVVNTTHFHDGYYYVQLLSEKDTNVLLTSHLRDLLEEYKSGKVFAVKYDDIEVNSIYATFYNDDNQFYRVRVKSKLPNSEMKVEFIDYGNDEIINDQIIIPISDKLSQIVPMVHKCIITDIRIKSYPKQELVAREILHRNYRAKLIKKRDEILNCDRVISLDYLDFTSVSYRSYLIMEDIADEVQYNGFKTDSRNGFKEEEISVVFTHFESLDEFYVQPVNQIVNDNLSYLSHIIADFVETIDSTDGYAGPNQQYISQFTQDNNWYRCRIVEDKFDKAEKNCLVQYIDFGNFEVKWNRDDLKPLVEKAGNHADELSSIPACAKKCKFSDDLIYALSKAKMEKEYFHQNFVLSETVVTFQYYFDQSNKMWIVENIVMPNKEEILSIVEKQCENTEKTDIYRLKNLESLNKIWFRLIKSVNPIIQENVTTIEQWSKERNFKDLEPIKQIILNHVYCAKIHNGYLIRCIVIAKNKYNVIVQCLDGGNYESVPIDSIFILNPKIASIPPLAKSYQFEFVICTEEYQIEEKIVQILGNSNVELVLIDDKHIKDVIIKEKSLVKCLAQLDFIEPTNLVASVPNNGTGVLDFKESNEETEPDEGVDFTLPSVEKMAEVPLEIAIYNAQIRTIRKLFSIHTENLFTDLFEVIEQCDKINNLIECCFEVDNLSTSVEGLNIEFVNLTTNIKTKLKDLAPLIEKRKDFSENICNLYTNLMGLLKTTSLENLEFLRVLIQKNIVNVNNLVEIFKISIDKYHDTEIDIKTIQNKIIDFQTSEMHLNLVKQFSDKAQITDDLISKYKLMLDSMYRDYKLGEMLPNPQSTVIPLIDSTYELHNAIKSETQHFIAILSQDDVIKNFDIINLIKDFYFYLQGQKISVDKIVEKVTKFQALNDYATAILIDDSAVFHKIEDNQKRILFYRSSLKHNLADMEDAEEQDEKEKIDEIFDKINNIRDPLHEALKTSKIMIDSEVEKLMMRKPELQLKNQSIFFGDEGIPIFLWDSIFFEIPRSDSEFFTTKFGMESVNMKKLLLNSCTVKNVLRNVTTYSTKIKQSNNSHVSLLPISYAFLSKSEKNTVYLILPNFISTSQIPEFYRNSLVSIVDFFKCLIDQLLDLWHSGFTYSEEDLQHGLFVTSLADPANNPQQMFLPLPLSSILNRENMNHKCESLHVYFSKLGSILQESLNSCAEPINIQLPAVQQLINGLNTCNGVQEAERVFWELDQFLSENGTSEKSVLLNDSLVDTDSSIIELPTNENDKINLSSSSNSDQSKSSSINSSVNEKVLEIYSDVE